LDERAWQSPGGRYVRAKRRLAVSVEVEERDDGIVTVWINWPEKRNALGPSDTRDVGEAIERAASLAATGVILTGVGAFCAGGDLEQFAELSRTSTAHDVRTRIYTNVHSVLRSIRACPVPVAAAVDGPAVGLGLDYALACDMCFVGTDGWMQQGWALAGLVHGAGGSAFVQRAGAQTLWKLIAEQPRLDGKDAQRLQLGEAVDGKALDAAVDRFHQLAQLPREVLEAYTTLFRDQRWPSEEFFGLCADFQAEFIASETFRARAESILEARAAR
jgi:enoyl-CoA hydratase/carnithine racemase